MLIDSISAHEAYFYTDNSKKTIGLCVSRSMEDGILSSQTKLGVRNRFQQIVLVKKPAKHTIYFNPYYETRLNGTSLTQGTPEDTVIGNVVEVVVWGGGCNSPRLDIQYRVSDILTISKPGGSVIKSEL